MITGLRSLKCPPVKFDPTEVEEEEEEEEEEKEQKRNFLVFSGPLEAEQVTFRRRTIDPPVGRENKAE